MYDKGKVILGLAVFLLLLTIPVWYNLAVGKSGGMPELEKVTDADTCVEAKEFMRASHMDLLNDWRNQVVREDKRVYQAKDGKKYLMSLSKTCLGCHSNKAEFCDKCHSYMGVNTPACWDCHVDPKEK